MKQSGFEKNTVSDYENGKREPNKDTLRAIAVHYMVSVEEFLSSDFSELGKITVNQNALREHIDEVLPVTCSEKAMTNSHFKKAYDIHRHFFDRLKLVEMDIAFTRIRRRSNLHNLRISILFKDCRLGVCIKDSVLLDDTCGSGGFLAGTNK